MKYVEFSRYNRWANARVFKVCLATEQALMDKDAAGTYGTIAKSLTHMVSVAEGFAALVLGAAAARGLASPGFTSLVGTTGMPDGYFDNDLDWFARREAEIDSFFINFAEGADEELLATEIQVPWLNNMPVT